MQIWPTDPKTKEPSVSLGILMVATAAMVIAIVLELLGHAKATGLVTEFFYGSVAMYFGRRFSVNKDEKNKTSSVSLETKQEE